MSSDRRARVLFVGEAITLSHVVRPAMLARALPTDRFDVRLACDPRYDTLLGPLPFDVVAIRSSIEQADVLSKLASGEPLFDAATLDAYVAEDLELIADFGPDLVVGDMRHSLAVSAHHAHVPFASIVNSHWSPRAPLDFDFGDHPLFRAVPAPLVDLVAPLFYPAGAAIYSLPMNVVRVKHGLFPLGPDTREIFCQGDYVLFADCPDIVRIPDLPPAHRYIGPVLWSPPVPLPEWWNEVKDEKPIVYVNLGSSGNPDLLGDVLAALAALDVTVVAATAGGALPTVVPRNAFCAPYLPGTLVARRARLAICNGGSMPVQQLLAAGVPTIGLTSNLDQLVFMRAVERAGAGVAVRARDVEAASLRRLVWRVLHHEPYTDSARRLAGSIAALDAGREFLRFVDEVLDAPLRARRARSYDGPSDR